MFLVRSFKKISVNKNIRFIYKRTLVNNISSNYIVNSGEPDIEIPNITLPELLTSYQNQYENFVAIECAETKRKYTFSEIRDKSTNFSKSLRKILKLENGDVVAVILRNIPEYPIANFGVMKANLIVTPVCPAFTSGEISRHLIDSGAKIIITEVDRFIQVKEALKISKMDLPIIVIKTQNHQSIPENSMNFHELVDANIDYPEIQPCDPSSVCFMPYSSGTTGLPKGVELTHRNMVATCLQLQSVDAELVDKATGNHQEVLPTILPFYHIFGQSLLCGCNHIGAKMITLPNFSPELYISVLKNNKSTLLYLVPPLVLMLIYHDGIKKEYLEHVKAILSGGAPLAASDEEQFLRKFGNKAYFLQGYGLTETSCGGTSLYPSILENIESYKGSVGRPNPNTLIKIVDPNDPGNIPLGPNKSGELLMKGPQIMKQYHNLPEETAKMMTEDGWLRTGDICHYNDDGFFFVSDRLKELIKVKGHQVAPAELEGVIRSYPGVADAAVIGVPHEKDGEVPRAYVVPEDKLDIQKLDKFVNDQVAKYKQLKGGIEIVDSIPKNATGKIIRKKLKEMYLK